ncbi:MAG: aminotransferase class I/II-fold pyridoxal phosphate-dependent enzyme [Acidimicrobiales bacterium]
MQHHDSAWARWASDELDAIESVGRRRRTRVFDALGPSGNLDGRPTVSFASNDYLGLSAHPAVQRAAIEAIERWGTGSTASRLVVGHRPVHAELESALARWKQSDAALVFPTGYAANLGVLTVLGAGASTILSDEWNHASIIDGCRLGKAPTRVFRHGDLDHLAHLLDTTEGRALVVSDTVFSMDGDLADVATLAELCARHDAVLVLDDAHTVFAGDGVIPEGHGAEVVRVGTLSKTLGSLGGFVAASAPVIDLLVNRARSFIFTTGTSPADAAASLAALEVVQSPEGDELRSRVRRHVDRLVPGHPSAIVPLVVGAEDDASVAAEALGQLGLLVPAIRPPTVPDGTSRLRVTMSAAHSDDDVDRLLHALTTVGLR